MDHADGMEGGSNGGGDGACVHGAETERCPLKDDCLGFGRGLMRTWLISSRKTRGLKRVPDFKEEDGRIEMSVGVGGDWFIRRRFMRRDIMR